MITWSYFTNTLTKAVQVKDRMYSTVSPILRNLKNKTVFIWNPVYEKMAKGKVFSFLFNPAFTKPVAIFAISFILPNLIGFRLGGIGARTFAASWQSLIGNVPPHSLFSCLTSLGARGYLPFISGFAGIFIHNIRRSLNALVHVCSQMKGRISSTVVPLLKLSLTKVAHVIVWVNDRITFYLNVLYKFIRNNWKFAL